MYFFICSKRFSKTFNVIVSPGEHYLFLVVLRESGIFKAGLKLEWFLLIKL